MDFITDFINNFNVSDNPTVYYTIGLVILIFIIIIVRSFLQMILVFAGIGVIILLMLYFTGNQVESQNINLTNIKTTISQQFNDIKHKFGFGTNEQNLPPTEGEGEPELQQNIEAEEESNEETLKKI